MGKRVAIIMDGNGRWAAKRGLKRTKGHEAGINSVRDIITHCARRGDIEDIILYAFSTENWKRPRHEVQFLMQMLQKYLQKEAQTYIKNNIRFETIGDLSVFSPSLREQIQTLKAQTQNATALTQYLALNYGSRDELQRACQKAAAAKSGDIQACLDYPRDLDIIIRTGGQLRLSNFLLYQGAYAELFFTHTLWPDFTAGEFDEILKSFATRDRRFGGL
ncbi:MAG: polyprenyl diphosphate synthase [Campylobacterota bacterium]